MPNLSLILMIIIMMSMIILMIMTAAHFPIVWSLQQTVFWFNFSLMDIMDIILDLVSNWNTIHMLYNLQIHCQNVNSLVRASNTESNLTIPILDHLLKTNCIQILSDTRINDLKLKKIKNILCKSSQIGIEKERFFSTLQDSSKVGGVSIYLPQYLDSCLSVIYTKTDSNEIPRFISLICKLQSNSNILICGFLFYFCFGPRMNELNI